MIIWLASYPKSGNTIVRSLLSSYIFSKNGEFNFDLLKNIKQFPDNALFNQIGVDSNNEKEMYKNYINAQKVFYNEKSIRFLKTHSAFVNQDNFKFTDGHNTIGVIYIVRDPRNVVTSYAHHTNITVDKAADDLINLSQMGGDLNKNRGSERTKVFTGTWNTNFHSWKSFKHEDRYLLIKYEDLINEKEKNFIKILEFIYKLQKSQFTLDKKKFENVIMTTSFSNMKKLEENLGFFESKIDKKTGKKIPFFNLGKKNEWKNLLDNKVRKKIENAFKKEMIELNYL